MEKEVIHVVVIEDDPIAQEINRTFIERVPSFQVVGVAGDGAKGMRLVKQLRPDFVVMDVFMPVQDGLRKLYGGVGRSTNGYVLVSTKELRGER